MLRTAEFLRCWFGATAHGFAILWASKVKKTKTTCFFDLSVDGWELGLTERAQELNAEGFDVYWQLCPQQSQPGAGQRGGSETALQVPGFWLDIDIAGEGHKGENLCPCVESARRLISRFPISPTAVVHSGGGIHAYWAFSNALSMANATEWKKQEDLSKRFQQFFRGKDVNPEGYAVDSTADLARVLRVPATSNWKTGGARPVSFLHFDADKVSREEIISALPPAPVTSEQLSKVAPAKPAGPKNNDMSILERARVYVAQIPGASEGEIRTTAFKVAAKIQVGFNLGEEAYPVYQDWNESNSPPLLDEELRECWRDGAKYAKNPPRELVDAPKRKKQGAGGEKTPNQADLLLDMCSDWELFAHQGTPFASFLIQNENGTFRRETHRFSRGGVRAQLVHRFWKIDGKAPSTEALIQVMAVLESRAMFEGGERPVFIRVGEHEGRAYLDLADPEGNVVETSEAGWRVTQDPPVRFLKTKGMLALPVPVAGGNLEPLRLLLGLPENQWRLIAGWLVFSLIPQWSKPILFLEGSMGSGKSILARILRYLIDPHAVPLRCVPADPAAAACMASNNWVLALDNLESIAKWLSNFLCCVATGGGYSARMHYSNDEESVMSFRRPAITTAIGGFSGAPDLGDRTLKIGVPTIAATARRRESDILEDLEKIRAGVLGALLDAVSAGLRNKGKVELPPLPRMADFAAFVIQAEELLPWPAGGFMEAFDSAREDSVETALEHDSLACAVRTLLLLNSGRWEGSPTELSDRLRNLDLSPLDKSSIPSPRKIQFRLRVLQGYLHAVGITSDSHRSNGRTVISLTRCGATSVPAEADPSQAPSNHFTEECTSTNFAEMEEFFL